jgi:hypothetical protein
MRGTPADGIAWVARIGAIACAVLLPFESAAQTRATQAPDAPSGPAPSGTASSGTASSGTAPSGADRAAGGADTPSGGSSGSVSTPPPLEVPYLQYGVAITTEIVADAGKMCSTAGIPCILGSGGGIVARIGRRSAGPWYFGGAYELSKQDPASLYRFATLQQLRAEARWYLNTGLDTYPYATATSGAVTYGNEWGIDTYGPIESLGVGLESQISRRTVVGVAFSYRVLWLNEFHDSAGNDRAGSLVQMAGIDLFVEERSPMVSSLAHQ